MKVDRAGKIKNTQLPRSKALLPVFEAIVNSSQAIEDAGADSARRGSTLSCSVRPVLPGLDVLGKSTASP
jgi:hypothetical protein